MSMVRRPQNFQAGFTLIEAMVAGSILALVALILFEGIGVCTRIAHENAQFLVADAYAHDLVWKRYNEDYAKLVVLLDRQFDENISSNAAPSLWIQNSPAVSHTRLSRPRTATGSTDPNGLVISVDVEWGAADARRMLSTSGHEVSIYKSGVGREDS